MPVPAASPAEGVDSSVGKTFSTAVFGRLDSERSQREQDISMLSRRFQHARAFKLELDSGPGPPNLQASKFCWTYHDDRTVTSCVLPVEQVIQLGFHSDGAPMNCSDRWPILLTVLVGPQPECPSLGAVIEKS